MTSVVFFYLDHDSFNSLHPLIERNITIHPDLGLKDQMLLDGEGTDEEIVLKNF